MKPRARKRKPFRVLRKGELRGNRASAREALAKSWDLWSSDSRRVVIQLDEKGSTNA